MKNLGLITPCYAADTSGVCSMLYELGGMVVVHDASGCNSTYTTHDEPRWTLTKSMIYISAFTELDAIMGNDEKLISDICSAAADQKPEFIAVCGSPMPMMTGVDFDAIATEIKIRTGIPTLALHTTGTHSYIDGASEALLEYVKKFVSYSAEKTPNGINILGATPLDFGLNSAINSIKQWLNENDFRVNAVFAMNAKKEDLLNAGKAQANLVISQTGFAAAEYMKRQFGIPYVLGAPIGRRFSLFLADNLRSAVKNSTISIVNRCNENDTIIIGEGISAYSLASALQLECSHTARIICPLPVTDKIMQAQDQVIYAEEDIKAELHSQAIRYVIADPLYRPLVPDSVKLIALPHFAFSGRCFANQIPDLMNKSLEVLFHD